MKLLSEKSELTCRLTKHKNFELFTSLRFGESCKSWRFRVEKLKLIELNFFSLEPKETMIRK